MSLPVPDRAPEAPDSSAPAEVRDGVPEIHGVYADDQLIEALRRGEITPYDRDAAAALLAAWRRSILLDSGVDAAEAGEREQHE